MFFFFSSRRRPKRLELVTWGPTVSLPVLSLVLKFVKKKKKNQLKGLDIFTEVIVLSEIISLSSQIMLLVLRNMLKTANMVRYFVTVR